MASLTHESIAASWRALVYFAQVECVSHEHRPVSFIESDGTRSPLQPCVYLEV